MQLLSKAISEILLADTDITDITSTGNIWHAKIPQQTTGGSTEPQSISLYFYTYAITPNDTKSGRSEVDNQMVRVHICGTDDHQMNTVARYVRLALDRITPGEYAEIYIQGSRFLNAYYEPEGNYQLELQEWRLEFQFRVIDPDIRVPPSSPPIFPTTSQANVMFREKVTLTYADFAVADTENDVAVFTLPIGGIVHGIIMNVTTAFGPNSYNISLGNTGDTAYYRSYMDCEVTGDSNPIWEIRVNDWTITQEIRAFATSLSNLNTANAGSISIYIYYSILN